MTHFMVSSSLHWPKGFGLAWGFQLKLACSEVKPDVKSEVSLKLSTEERDQASTSQNAHCLPFPLPSGLVAQPFQPMGQMNGPRSVRGLLNLIPGVNPVHGASPSRA